MASTDSDDQSSKARTKPMSGFESLGPLPIPETIAPVRTSGSYGDTAAPTQAKSGGTSTPVSTPTPAAAASGSMFRDYKLGRMLGRGGFGKVYLADAPGGVPVAIKIVEARRDDNEAAGRELSALEVIKTLRHPYLLSTHAFYSEEEQLAIVMELADGSLRDELEKSRKVGKGGLPPDVLVRYMIEAGEAIDYLHDKKMTHRDIKPENILLLAGHAKVADFGLVRVVQENRAQASVSLTGTLAYMAPEVFRGHTHKNSDQYALALTYLELRFGERFVTTTDLVEAMLRHVEHEPDLSRAEPHEQKVIKRALAKDPEQRFGSCTEMARALAEGFGKTEIRGKSDRPVWEPEATRPPAKLPIAPTPGLKPKEKPARRKPPVALIAGVAAVALLGIAGLVWLIVHPSPPRPTPPATNPGNGAIVPIVAPEWTVEPVQGTEIELDNGKNYHREVDLVLDEKTRLRLILIRQQSGAVAEGTGIPTFYMMRDKVSYALFERFAAANKQLHSSEWKAGAATEDGPKKDPRLPVMAVTPEDAYKFALWLGGDLPSLEQWRKAAGYYNRGSKFGPYDPVFKKGEIGINRPEQGPLFVDESTKDLSPYGIRDMAGNGKELTHNLQINNTKRVPLSPPIPQFERVIQVGKSYAAPEPPLQFTDLEQEKLETAPYNGTDEYCGFRVVFKVP